LEIFWGVLAVGVAVWIVFALKTGKTLVLGFGRTPFIAHRGRNPVDFWIMIAGLLAVFLGLIYSAACG
jgi:hypothetical protein